MMENLYAGITRFCAYWKNAPILQGTYGSLCNELDSESDGCIDAAKALVECACKVLISELDDAENPISDWPDSPVKTGTPSITNLVSAVVKLLKLSDRRNDPFNKVISQHNKLATELGNFRNSAGTLSHGKNGLCKKLSTHHRKSAILSADAIVHFLHEAYLERQLNPVNSFEPFERFSDQSAVIDRHCVISSADIEEDCLRVKITQPDIDDIELTFNPSDLLFFADRIAYKSAFNASNGLADEERPIEQ